VLGARPRARAKFRPGGRIDSVTRPDQIAEVGTLELAFAAGTMHRRAHFGGRGERPSRMHRFSRRAHKHGRSGCRRRVSIGRRSDASGHSSDVGITECPLTLSRWDFVDRECRHFAGMRWLFAWYIPNHVSGLCSRSKRVGGPRAQRRRRRLRCTGMGSPRYSAPAFLSRTLRPCFLLLHEPTESARWMLRRHQFR